MTLEELLELYTGSMKRQARLMKAMAAAMGADVPLDDDDDFGGTGSSLSNDGYNIQGHNDLGFLPINVGYETID